jgi:hypothetical protein
MQIRFPWETDPPPGAEPVVEPPPKPRGRRVVAAAAGTSPHWLYHHLTIHGPAKPVTAFAAAARGSGVIPWQLDLAALEEDIFVRTVSQPAASRNLSVAGCRILARQFRERVEARQARAAALVGCSRACPFDLHTLLPVPAEILQRGPVDPEALAWLSTHWGTTDHPRQVTERPVTVRRLPKDHAAIGYGFFTDGDTPQAAVDRLGGAWPALTFMLQPAA